MYEIGDENPDNVLPCGPLDLSPEAINNEISGDRYAIGVSAVGLAVSVTLGVTEVIPNIVHAIETNDLGELVNYSTLGALVCGFSFIAISNIRSYRARLKQAMFNRQLYKIAEDNGLNPEQS